MTVSAGRNFPIGATPVEGGVNFCVYSKRTSRLELLLFDDAGDAEPAKGIRLDAVTVPNDPDRMGRRSPCADR